MTFNVVILGGTGRGFLKTIQQGCMNEVGTRAILYELREPRDNRLNY